MHHQLVGNITFTDEKNGIEASVDIGAQKGKPKDYFSGRIYRIGAGGQELETVSTLYGNYMGYVDIDRKRYFDVRDQKVQEVIPLALPAPFSANRQHVPASQ